MSKYNPFFIATNEQTKIFHEQHPIQFQLGWVQIFASAIIACWSVEKYAFDLQTGIIFLILCGLLVMYDRHVVNVAIKALKDKNTLN